MKSTIKYYINVYNLKRIINKEGPRILGPFSLLSEAQQHLKDLKRKENVIGRIVER